MLTRRPQRKGRRQRFYARNAVKTTLDMVFGYLAFEHLMRSFEADPANSPHTTGIHPALTSFADEVAATAARLMAYVGTLALLAILGIALWDQLPDALAGEPLDGSIHAIKQRVTISPGSSRAVGPAPATDWVTGSENPHLRDAL
jgi:hypothetical protein